MNKNNRIKLITLDEPTSNFSEVIRLIRTNIEYSSIDNPVRVVNFTSSVANEAKTTTACNLAVMNASKYKRVLLIDLDLRNPSIHRAFGIKNKAGMTNLLVDFVENGENVQIEKYLSKIKHEHIINDLYVLTAGSEVVNPTEIIGSKKMKSLIQLLKQHFDFIVVDSAPSSIISDGVIVSTICDGTVFIVESGKTKIDVAQRTIDHLKSVNANLIGCVLTKVPTKSVDYGYYYEEDHDEVEKNKDRIEINVE